MARAANNRRRF